MTGELRKVPTVHNPQHWRGGCLRYSVPVPVTGKLRRLPTLSVPPQHRFGLYDEERGSPAAKPPTRQHPETPVRVLKARPWLAALQDHRLLPQAKVRTLLACT
jgi:hypothetical protein